MIRKLQDCVEGPTQDLIFNVGELKDDQGQTIEGPREVMRWRLDGVAIVLGARIAVAATVVSEAHAALLRALRTSEKVQLDGQRWVQLLPSPASTIRLFWNGEAFVTFLPGGRSLVGGNEDPAAAREAVAAWMRKAVPS